MRWYLAGLRKYGVSAGRARRLEFWMFALCHAVVLRTLAFADGGLGLTDALAARYFTTYQRWLPELFSGRSVLSLAYGVVFLPPWINVAVRRLHDTGRSGRWFLAVLIPMLGQLVLLAPMMRADAGAVSVLSPRLLAALSATCYQMGLLGAIALLVLLLFVDGQPGRNAYGRDPADDAEGDELPPPPRPELAASSTDEAPWVPESATLDGSAPDVSIVVLGRDGRRLTHACLSALFEHAGDLALEVFYVDNGSTDGSVAMVEDTFSTVQTIATGGNVGFARANNQAIRRMRGRYGLVLNNDTRVRAGALQTALEYLEATPDVGLLGANLLYPDGRRQNAVHNTPTLLSEAVPRSLLKILMPGRFPSRRQAPVAPIDVEAVLGAFMMFPRARLLNEVGSLDDGYLFYLEETDWCHRVRQAGLRVVHHPGVEVVHDHGATAAATKVAARIEYARSLYRFFVRVHGRAAARALWVVTVARLVWRGAWATLAVSVSLGRWGRQRARVRQYAYLLAWHLRGRPADWGLATGFPDVRGGDPRASDVAAAQERRAWNGPRLRPRGGRGFEVWYVTAVDPVSRLGLWIRYTLSVQRGRLGHGAVWLGAFDRGRGVVLQRRHKLADVYVGDDGVAIGPDGRFVAGRLQGRVQRGRHVAHWDLQLDASDRPVPLLPASGYSLLPGTRIVATSLDARLSGTITLDEETWELDRIPAAQGHIWGRRQSDAWCSVHCNAFETPGVVCEALSVQFERGAELGPPRTLIVVRVDGREVRLTGWIDMLWRNCATVCREPLWAFEGQGGGIEVRGLVRCRWEEMVAVRYEDAEGGPVVCYHTEVATLELAVQRGRAAGYERFVGKRTAAFEFAGRDLEMPM